MHVEVLLHDPARLGLDWFHEIGLFRFLENSGMCCCLTMAKGHKGFFLQKQDLVAELRADPLIPTNFDRIQTTRQVLERFKYWHERWGSSHKPREHEKDIVAAYAALNNRPGA